MTYICCLEDAAFDANDSVFSVKNYKKYFVRNICSQENVFIKRKVNNKLGHFITI